MIMKRNITYAVFLLLMFMPILHVSAQKTYTDLRDKSTYKVVEFGNKVWMAENLRYLPSVNPSGNLEPEDFYTEKYYVYGYDGNSVEEAKSTQEYKTYGVLYNMTAAKKACPEGWHLAKDSDWKNLEKILGISGNQLKEIGNRGDDQGSRMAGDTSLWIVKGDEKIKSDVFGSSGFLALPGGFLGSNGKFISKGAKASFWTSTEYCEGYSYFRSIGANSKSIYRNKDDDRTAMSVRCVSDYYW